MSKALCQISMSPFTHRIKRPKFPHFFAQLTFTIYDGRTNPMKHVSHFNQRMAIHSSNQALIYKVFLSSLEPIAMRWFDGLGEGSISSFKGLTKVFGVRFMTCSRVPKPLDFLLSMAMKESETLKTYSDRYQELFNEINRDFEDEAIKTFKVGLPMNHDLRKSLTTKPARNMCQLMDRIDEHRRVKKDQVQAKGKAKVFTPERKDPQPDRYGLLTDQGEILSTNLHSLMPRWLL